MHPFEGAGLLISEDWPAAALIFSAPANASQFVMNFIIMYAPELQNQDLRFHDLMCVR